MRTVLFNNGLVLDCGDKDVTGIIADDYFYLAINGTQDLYTVFSVAYEMNVLDVIIEYSSCNTIIASGKTFKLYFLEGELIKMTIYDGYDTTAYYVVKYLK